MLIFCMQDGMIDKVCSLFGSRFWYLVIFRDARQFELLLQQIYRAHNSYCIHIDPRAEQLFKDSVENIINCYEQKFEKRNIFLVENPVNVTWSHISMLDADILCMKVSKFFSIFHFLLCNFPPVRLFLTSFPLGSSLWISERFQKKMYQPRPSFKEENKVSFWDLILAGSEYPRYRNIEFIRRAQLTGTGYIRSVPLSSSNKKIKFSWKLSQSAQFDHNKSHRNQPLKRTKILKDPPPFGLKVFKGVRSFMVIIWLFYIDTQS